MLTQKIVNKYFFFFPEKITSCYTTNLVRYGRRADVNQHGIFVTTRSHHVFLIVLFTDFPNALPGCHYKELNSKSKSWTVLGKTYMFVILRGARRHLSDRRTTKKQDYQLSTKPYANCANIMIGFVLGCIRCISMARRCSMGWPRT